MWPYVRMTLKGGALISSFAAGAVLMSLLPWWVLITLFALAACMWVGSLMEDVD